MSKPHPSILSTDQRTATPGWSRRSLLLVATAVLVSGTSWTAATVAQRISRPDETEPVAATSAHDGSRGIVTAPALADLLNSDDSTVVDLSDHRRYAIEHIPGAVHGWWQDGMEWNAFSYGQVVDNTEIEDERMRWVTSLGIGQDSRVIAYDDDGGRRAARLVWTLGMIGIADAAILDGGLGAWKSSGYAVTTTPSRPTPAPPFPEPSTDGWRMLTDPLHERIGTDRIALVDVRTDAERASTLNDTIPLGTIPGSVRLPRTAVTDEATGLLLLMPDLERVFAEAGIPHDRPVVLYGLFGQDTALVWLALRAAGYDNEVIAYDEGWMFWASQPGLPIEPIGS